MAFLSASLAFRAALLAGIPTSSAKKTRCKRDHHHGSRDDQTSHTPTAITIYTNAYRNKGRTAVAITIIWIYSKSHSEGIHPLRIYDPNDKFCNYFRMF
mmetsp:Transcript_28859/g.68759  ORF Transcript_28859/g.68759 Transcript_28859/m.68759 type:complete len:99 (-) Transcript_28859:97-393(-)